MQSELSWKDVKRTVAAARYCALATVNEDGEAQVTPIGSVFFTAEGRGFYFEEYPSIMPGNLEHDARLAILAVTGNKASWLRRFFRRSLPGPSPLRIKVNAGRRRVATGVEWAAWQALARPSSWLRGNLGRGMRFVREFTVEGVAPIHLGAMCK